MSSVKTKQIGSAFFSTPSQWWSKKKQENNKKTKILKLFQWRLRRTNSGSVFLEGFLKSNQLWRSSPIESRVSSRELITSTGSIYELIGSIDGETSIKFGLSRNLVKVFANGFPEDWENKINLNHSEESEKMDVESCRIDISRLTRTKSGRIVIPRLEFWRGERVARNDDGKMYIAAGFAIDQSLSILPKESAYRYSKNCSKRTCSFNTSANKYNNEKLVTVSFIKESKKEKVCSKQTTMCVNGINAGDEHFDSHRGDKRTEIIIGQTHLPTSKLRNRRATTLRSHSRSNHNFGNSASKLEKVETGLNSSCTIIYSNTVPNSNSDNECEKEHAKSNAKFVKRKNRNNKISVSCSKRKIKCSDPNAKRVKKDARLNEKDLVESVMTCAAISDKKRNADGILSPTRRRQESKLATKRRENKKCVSDVNVAKKSTENREFLTPKLQALKTPTNKVSNEVIKGQKKIPRPGTMRYANHIRKILTEYNTCEDDDDGNDFLATTPYRETVSSLKISESFLEKTRKDNDDEDISKMMTPKNSTLLTPCAPKKTPDISGGIAGNLIQPIDLKTADVIVYRHKKTAKQKKLPASQTKYQNRLPEKSAQLPELLTSKSVLEYLVEAVSDHEEDETDKDYYFSDDEEN